jgi:hypothetical protein
MRHSMANEKKLRSRPSTNDSGPTHASVSESTIDDVTNVIVDAIILKMFVESFTTEESISILAGVPRANDGVIVEPSVAEENEAQRDG